MKWAIVISTPRASPLSPPRHAPYAVDGDWCYSDGRHLSIEGPTIITPPAGRLKAIIHGTPIHRARRPSREHSSSP